MSERSKGSEMTWKEIGELLVEETDDTAVILDALEKTKKGTVRQSKKNCMTVLKNDPVLRKAISRNELTGRIDIVKKVPWKRRSTTITDTDLNNIKLYMEENYELCSDGNIEKAVDITASENSYHPIRDYLESLKWDGESRIRSLLPKYLGADDDKYTYSVMKLLMIAAISRIYEWGCKFEIMICLVGGQGAGKSTFFRFLACRDEWFTDDLKRMDDEKVYQKMQGHWIIEMSEMMATVNARSIEEIKSFISRQKETYKIPYDRFPEDRPRQCVFVGTTNNLDFLPLDRSGNRRFAPVMVHPERVKKHILEDEEESRAYIAQAWAEAMCLYKSGDRSLTLPSSIEEHLKEIQEQFMPEDTKAGMIEAWLEETQEEYVCSKMIFCEALGHEGDDPKPWELREINSIMNQSVTGWTPIATHRFTKYGSQRGWKRVTDADGFVKAPEQMKLPLS